MDATSDLTLEFDQAGAEVGKSVASGDVNGDGYADLLIGQPVWSAMASSAGRVGIHFGSATGVAAAPNTVIQLEAA